MENIIAAIILAIIAIGCFVVGFLQFNEKGFLFNNAYIYATKKERENMDKKSHYRQSGIVFLMIGTIFLLNALEAMFETGWILYLVIAVVTLTVIYAIVSSVRIEKRSRDK